MSTPEKLKRAVAVTALLAISSPLLESCAALGSEDSAGPHCNWLHGHVSLQIGRSAWLHSSPDIETSSRIGKTHKPAPIDIGNHPKMTNACWLDIFVDGQRERLVGFPIADMDTRLSAAITDKTRHHIEKDQLSMLWVDSNSDAVKHTVYQLPQGDSWPK